jgi:asparagine synthetase B (glutamine-hydrolysing)
VAIEADPDQGSVTIARDHLGTFKVYYYLDQRWLIAASDTALIRRHEAVGDELDQNAIARFLAFRFSQSACSFFRNIKELPPAHCLRVTADDCRAQQYWSFRVDRTGRKASPAGVHEKFRSVLQRSVTNELSDSDPSRVALSLSGGLDSTTLAALMPSGVRAFSWYFEKVMGGDERHKIEAVARQVKMPIHWVEGDGLYPLCGDYVERFVDEDSPVYNPFAALKHRLYETARAEGCEQIVVGDGGDALYSASEYWLRDTVADTGWRAFASFGMTIKGAICGDRFAQAALKRLLPISSIQSRIGRRRSVPWLTDAGYSLLPGEALSPILPEGRNRRRFDLIAGAKHTDIESAERRLFSSCGVGRSNPFWCWPLLEMVMNLPAYWYSRGGMSKVLTRQAMSGLLPASVLESGRTGLLGEFFLRGIESTRSTLREILFVHPQSDWQRYVERAWLEPYLMNCETISFGHTILWRVISYELWYRRLAGWSQVW